MSAHWKTWKILAGANATTWRALAAQAKGDPTLAALLGRVADAFESVDAYLAGKEETAP